MSITVTLPDGKALALGDEGTGADAAAAIGPGLARAALAVTVAEPGAGPEVRDLSRTWWTARRSRSSRRAAGRVPWS